MVSFKDITIYANVWHDQYMLNVENDEKLQSYQFKSPTTNSQTKLADLMSRSYQGKKLSELTKEEQLQMAEDEYG